MLEGGTLFTARQFATFFEVIQPAVFLQICKVYYAMFSKQSYISITAIYMYSILALLWKYSTVYGLAPLMQILYL